MNDLEDFRTALRGPAVPHGRPAAVDEIMAAGRRLRRRRRWAVASVAAGVTAVVAFGGAAAVQYGVAGPQQVAAVPGPSSSAPQSPGGMVRTGMRQPAGEVVFALTPMGRPGSAAIGVGVQVCFADAGDTLTGCRTFSHPAVPEDSPGFHGVVMPDVVEGNNALPMFGYYVGPAARITAVSDGRAVTARTARQTVPWRQGSDVVLWWFPLDQVSGPKGGASGKADDETYPRVTDWAARDEQGRPLPTGHVETYRL